VVLVHTKLHYESTTCVINKTGYTISYVTLGLNSCLVILCYLCFFCYCLVILMVFQPFRESLLRHDYSVYLIHICCDFSLCFACVCFFFFFFIFFFVFFRLFVFRSLVVFFGLFVSLFVSLFLCVFRCCVFSVFRYLLFFCTMRPIHVGITT